MSFWTKLFGGSAAEPIDALGSAVDKIFTNDEERMQAQAVLNKVAQKLAILKAEIILHKQRCIISLFKCVTVSYCNLSFYSVFN